TIAAYWRGPERRLSKREPVRSTKVDRVRFADTAPDRLADLGGASAPEGMPAQIIDKLNKGDQRAPCWPLPWRVTSAESRLVISPSETSSIGFGVLISRHSAIQPKGPLTFDP